MLTRKGLPGGQYKPLGEDDIKAIHETSLRVLEEVGFQANLPEATELFKKAGAHLDGGNGTVKVPRDMVMELILSLIHI